MKSLLCLLLYHRWRIIDSRICWVTYRNPNNPNVREWQRPRVVATYYCSRCDKRKVEIKEFGTQEEAEAYKWTVDR